VHRKVGSFYNEKQNSLQTATGDDAWNAELALKVQGVSIITKQFPTVQLRRVVVS
jgi:hypothetical protein